MKINLNNLVIEFESKEELLKFLNSSSPNEEIEKIKEIIEPSGFFPKKTRSSGFKKWNSGKKLERVPQKVREILYDIMVKSKLRFFIEKDSSGVNNFVFYDSNNIKIYSNFRALCSDKIYVKYDNNIYEDIIPGISQEEYLQEFLQKETDKYYQLK